MSQQNDEQQGYVPALALLLFLSGSCALIFQIVWIRELRLVFGATTFASAAVLAIFMGGLGLGNGLLGRTIDRVKNPIRFYAWLEFGIAILAALSPLLIDLTRTIYVMMGGQATLSLGFATTLRLLASMAILAAPTFLMGGTLPAAARAVSNDVDQRRRGVALLYGLNTLGAVVGAGLANFLLIELLGNRGTLWSACLVNALLAVAAFQYSRSLSRAPTVSRRRTKAARRSRENSEPETNTIVHQQLKAFPAVVYIASAVVGFAFFLMEIVWYRMLGPLLGGTTYTFGLILCIALLGIGLGGAIYNVCGRWVRPTTSLLSVTCGLEALFIAVPFWYGDSIAIWALRESMETVSTFGDQVWNWLHISAFVILPASLVAGFQFPLLIAIAGAGRADIGKHVGLTFAANTVGAICGSLAGGFLLLPMLSAPGLWRAVALVLVALGGVTAVFAHRPKHLLWAWVVSGTLAVVAILGDGPTAAWRHSGIGAGRAQAIEGGRNAEQEFINSKRRQCVWEAEGVETSVGVTLTDSIAFIVNGKSDGNAYGDAGTQVGLGLIGPLLHPSLEDGLVIGLGTGESAGWMADCDGIQSVDVIELEPAIAEVAVRCGAMNRNALENPRVEVYYNDAREHLLTTAKRYDIIVSEPSNPYRAGIANLYTQEFYSAVFDRLQDDGMFVQWVQGYEVDDRTVSIVLNTVRSTFPHLQIWRTRARDMLLVCGKSEKALAYDAALLKNRLAGSTTIREGLRLAWQVDDVEGIVAHYVCGRRTVDDWLRDQKLSVNTDDRNLLEYAFAKSLGKSTRFSIQDLHVRSRRNDDALPIPLVSIESKKVDIRRLAMNLHLGGLVPDASDLPFHVLPRARAYSFYLARKYPDAVTAFSAIEIDSTCPIDRLLYAHSLAELGAVVPSDMMEAIKTENATEAFALSAIRYLRGGERKRGIDSAVATFTSLRENPWGNTQLLDSVLRLSASVAETDREGAVLLFESLKEPFAMFRLEDKRLLARYVISENIGNGQMIEALSAIEPHVPWKGWLLQQRAKVYSTEKHALSDRANADLQQFRQWSR